MAYFINTDNNLSLSYDGSESFAGGQVSAIKASLIPADAVSLLLNMDNTINGEFVTRRGTQKVGTEPRTTPVNGLFQHDFGSGTKRMVYATRTGGTGELYRESGGTYTALGGTWTSGTMTDATQVFFAELEGTLYISNGLSDMHKVAPGAAGADAFSVASNMPTDDDAHAPPKPRMIVTHTGRICAVGSNQSVNPGPNVHPVTVYFSQFLDGTVWDRVNWTVTVGRREDQIMGLVPWTNYDLVVLKEHSVHLINCDPTLPSPASFKATVVHPHIGCTCPRTAVQVGDSVLFLSRDGVYSVDRSPATDTLSEITVPISTDINDIIQRINWSRAPITAAAFFWNNRYFLGIPLDNDQENTWVVLNTVTGKWLGTWGRDVQPRVFARNDSLTQPRLRFGRPDGKVYEWLDFVQESAEVATTYQDNATDYLTRMISRGYVFGSVKAEKDLYNGVVEFNKSTADALIGIRLDGNAELGIGQVSTGFGDVILDKDGSITGVTGPQIPFPITNKQIILRELGLSNMPSAHEIAVDILSLSGKLGIRSIQLAAFVGSDQAAPIDAAIVITPP